MTETHDQFIRKWTLIYASGQQGLDLSQLHLRFELHQSDTQTPNTAVVRVYNLADATVKKLYALTAKSLGGTAAPTAPGPEYARLILQAGYVNGNFGIIFDGTVKELSSGKESAVDTFVEVEASDIDLPYNFGTVSQTLGPGATPQQQAKALLAGMQQQSAVPLSAGDLSQLGTGGTLPRGKVLYGLGRDYLHGLGTTTGTRLSFQNGVLEAVPFTGYLPSEAVVVNAQSGLVGVPQLTQNGLECRMLLNPKLRIGTLLKLNNADVNQTSVVNRGSGGLVGNETAQYASTSADGLYRVAVVEHQGDTRGTPWYSDVTALAVDASAPSARSVKKYG